MYRRGTMKSQRRSVVGRGASRSCRLLAASVTAITALAGCGSSTLPADEIKTVVHRWERAVATRNVNEACALLDNRGRAMIKREEARTVAVLHISSSCPAVIGFLHDYLLSPSTRKSFGTTTPHDVKITGDTARVRAEAIFWLTMADGVWRISEVPLAVG
jgi:hypothetical protein